MANLLKPQLLDSLRSRYGNIRKLDGSQSLYELGDGAARIYIRYSKLHRENQAFYGLRKDDLRQLEGFPSVVCFLWDRQVEPLFVPFAEYEDIFHSYSPASDGQYKAMVYVQDTGTELYLSKMGRFNVEGNLGLRALDELIDNAKLRNVPDLSHSQIQTLLGSVGATKGFDIWIPQNDRRGLDWNMAREFKCRNELPGTFESVRSILQEVDVVWLDKGSGSLEALFEVEHSTPVYSGLLRFNDVHLVAPKVISRFTIVSNDTRRSLFTRQLNRPTFRASGLSDICTFMEYVNVFGWFNRLQTNATNDIKN